MATCSETAFTMSTDSTILPRPMAINYSRRKSAGERDSAIDVTARPAFGASNCWLPGLARNCINYERESRNFGNLTNFGGGLSPLPAWVRRLHRVERWVRAKLIVSALRACYHRQKALAKS